MAVPWYYHGIIIFQKLQKLYFQQNTYPYFFAADITYERRFAADPFSTLLAASVLHTHTHTKERLFYEGENEVTLDKSVCGVWSLTSYPFRLDSELVQTALSFHCWTELCGGLWEEKIYVNNHN